MHRTGRTGEMLYMDKLYTHDLTVMYTSDEALSTSPVILHLKQRALSKYKVFRLNLSTHDNQKCVTVTSGLFWDKVISIKTAVKLRFYGFLTPLR